MVFRFLLLFLSSYHILHITFWQIYYCFFITRYIYKIESYTTLYPIIQLLRDLFCECYLDAK